MPTMLMDFSRALLLQSEASFSFVFKVGIHYKQKPKNLFEWICKNDNIVIFLQYNILQDL